MHRSKLARTRRPNQWQFSHQHQAVPLAVVVAPISCREQCLWRTADFRVNLVSQALLCWCVQSIFFGSVVRLVIFRNHNWFVDLVAKSCPKNIFQNNWITGKTLQKHKQKRKRKISLTSGSTSLAKIFISSAESWAKRSSTSTSSYSLKFFPYNFAGVVIVVVFVDDDVCQSDNTKNKKKKTKKKEEKHVKTYFVYGFRCASLNFHYRETQNEEKELCEENNGKERKIGASVNLIWDRFRVTAHLIKVFCFLFLLRWPSFLLNRLMTEELRSE